ncbi:MULTISPECIES: hypothetical protein [unclassified Methylophaga]|jgi:hypothetical protein|uniref:hypothetical protein n=1 Tax=unclassified Methylophaga TaxID=2629249 RepID=UPI000C0D4C12|nr:MULTISPECIES: hypothetical protein [unclassified Methylophaga]MBL1457324.1 hypothetical protein [Methylophaga sp.]|tara:strand:+ start:3498 stop:4046 length:549 start_codon:yes stop_codon:yes gene_type:complete
MKIAKISLILVAILYLSGCASGAKVENMTYQGAQKNYSEGLKQSVEVAKVSGGKETNPLWTSEISSDAFSTAVKQSLSTQGLLSDNGRYKLTVNMLSVDQPFMGFDLEVTTYVEYSLVDSTNDSVIFKETIIAPYTATMSDAFAAIKRLRLANEGAGQKNIEMLLEKLSELKINQSEISLAE